MTKHFNRKEMQERRRQLRSNMTYCEKLIWMYLRKRQLKERFLRQYSIDNYVIDFYCPKLKLAVEVDGDIHELYEQKEYDKYRQEYLENMGINFIRIKNEELLGNANKAFDRIENEIKRLVLKKLLKILEQKLISTLSQFVQSITDCELTFELSILSATVTVIKYFLVASFDKSSCR